MDKWLHFLLCNKYYQLIKVQLANAIDDSLVVKVIII